MHAENHSLVLRRLPNVIRNAVVLHVGQISAVAETRIHSTGTPNCRRSDYSFSSILLH